MAAKQQSGAVEKTPDKQNAGTRETALRQLLRHMPKIRRLSWRDLAMALGPVLILAALAVFLVVYFVAPPPPRTLTIISGPIGSNFYKYAEDYRAVLARSGVTLKVLRSTGSLENLNRLSDPHSGVDIAFVQGGVTTSHPAGDLVSLGSVFYEPLVVFYDGSKPLTRLSQLRGQSIGIGMKGSGTRFLALALLKANGIEPGGSTQLDGIEGGAAVQALIGGRVEAIFLSGDSASTANLRELLLAPSTRLFDFTLADAYVRRFRYLNKLDIPPGTFDLGDDLPKQSLTMLAPTVELLAHSDLNPALTDLLIDAAREVNGRGTLLQNPGEFPAPLQHTWPISNEAQRYYKYGKGFAYRHLSFWAANLASRALVILVPLLVVLLPFLPYMPALYGWRVKGRIYKRYGELMEVEREALGPLSPEQRDALTRRLNGIEKAIIDTRIPGAYANQLYVLRQHVKFVREQLSVAPSRIASAST